MMLRIDISKFIQMLIHPFQLTVFNIKWIECLMYPFRALLINFYRQREEDIYRLEHNGQVCYLRAILNDKFDNAERRITISDTARLEYIYFYPELDEKAVLHSNSLDEAVIFPQSIYIGGDETANFNVNVPFALSEDELIRMRSILNEYKLVSKKYAIAHG